MADFWHGTLAFEWRELDGEAIAYCDITGDTFKLAPIARAVLDAVGRAPADLQALSAAVAESLKTANRTAIETVVADTVEDLESLGIIERVSL